MDFKIGIVIMMVKFVAAMFLFFVFWLISTPIYGIAHLFDLMDRRLSDMLDNFFNDWI